MSVLKFLLRHRRIVAVLHIAVVLAMLPGILLLRQDNSPEVFFARDAGAMERYRQFRREFGGGRAVRVALSGPGLWTTPGLAWLDEVEKRAASLPGVETALGLAAYYRWLLLEWPPTDPAAFRSRVLNDAPDLFKGLLSRDGETITLLVVSADLPPGGERELLSGLHDLLSRPPPGIRASLSGLPVLHRAMDRSLAGIATSVLPFLVLLAVVFLAVIFRRVWDVMAPIFFVSVCQVILFGIMGYAGARLNLVNIILAPLLFVITLAAAVHLLVRFRYFRQQNEKIPDAVFATYRSKGLPVLWTGLTTLAAFGSLVTAGLPPLRSVGAWSALGIAIMTILAFTLYPVLLAGARPGAAQPRVSPYEGWARCRGRAWARWTVRRRAWVIAAMAATLVIGLIGVTQLGVEDNLGKYFPPHHPVRLRLETLQQQGVGVYAAELILSYRGGKRGAGDEENAGFLNPPAQQKLTLLSQRLRSEPLIYGTVSSGDLVETSIRSILVEGEVTDNIRWMALGLLQTGEDSRKLLHTLVSADGQSARVTLLVPMLSFNRAQPLLDRAAAEAAQLFPGADTWITGRYPLILLAQRTLLRGLITALSLTLLCVVLAFLLLLRSARLTFLMLVPNLWPVVLVLGGMGLLKLPLDSASVMTAAIVLGLAVDDTFHTLAHFLRAVRHAGPAQAIEKTLERTAPAHMLTSVILIIGFAVCYFIDLQPISRMGALSAAAIALALVGDLLLIPALLAVTGTASRLEKNV